MFYRTTGGLCAAAALLTASAFLAAAACGAAGASAPTDTHPAADLIVRNAHIWTVNPKQPQADALAPEATRDTHILETWLGGVEIFDAGSRN